MLLLPPVLIANRNKINASWSLDTIGIEDTKPFGSAFTTKSPFTLEAKKRSYQSGGVANLFRGEPMLIVYGTKKPKDVDSLKAAAEHMARYSGAWRSMVTGGFKVIADQSLLIIIKSITILF